MSKVRGVFDEAAHGYDDWYGAPKGRQVYQLELEAVEKYLPPSGVGVEFGAGTGVFAEGLMNGLRVVLCVDISTSMLRNALKRGLPSILASAKEPPFREGTLGFGYMITVLEFLEEPSETLRNCSEVIRNGAPFVLLTINRESPWGEMYEESGRSGSLIFSNARLYSFDEVTSMIDEADLELEEAYGTLTKGPEDPDAGSSRVEAGPGPGILIFLIRD